MGEQSPSGEPDVLIARMAARQHGVISHAQLHRAGIRRQSLTRRVQSGRLHRIHRGVYAVGHRGLSREGRWMAAVLACRAGAVLSQTSAGELWGILRLSRHSSPAGSRPAISHVTVSGEAKSRPGIKVHRSRTLEASQTTRRLGIPVTTPSRTLADLRRILPKRRFAAALRQAEFLGLPIESRLEADRTRSELEARFLSVCRRHRLPRPEVNRCIGPFTVDFLWPERRLIVEVDGFRAHGGRSAFEDDRARDVALRLRGFEVVRFTWRHLEQDRGQIADALRALLKRSRRAA